MDISSAKQDLKQLTKKKLLERSSQFIFSTGLDDSACRLCQANMKYDLAKFHLIQQKYGMEPRATFISSPDETVTRNTVRWGSGLGYGGRLNWGNGDEKLIFLSVKPNCCGILVGGLQEVPDPYNIIKKIDKIKDTDLFYKDIYINWDYGISNHFINCFETRNLSDEEFPPYMFMIHGSAPEFRDDTHGLGLYFDKSETLRNRAILEETKFGSEYILMDSDANDYMDYVRQAIKFSNIKREMIANNIFGYDYKIICNQVHQFLSDYNNMYLGTNCTDLNNSIIEKNIFPIALRADIAAYLFRGKKNLLDSTINNLGIRERAKRLGLLELLQNVNILPHGGGYAFPDMKKVREVLEYKDQRYFVCELKKKSNRLKIIKDVGDIQYQYRGRDVVLKTLQLDLGEMLVRLKPIFSLKL
ncbi:MAG: hypothetical protein ACOC44_01295 [Promethearchaeia archaeon]